MGNERNVPQDQFVELLGNLPLAAWNRSHAAMIRREFASAILI